MASATTTSCRGRPWCSCATVMPGSSCGARPSTTSSRVTWFRKMPTSDGRHAAVMDKVRVGVLGCGNVGSALVRLVHEHADIIEARAGVPLEITRVAVRDVDQGPGPAAPAAAASPTTPPTVVERSRRRHRRRGDRRDRAAAGADRRSTHGRQARGHGEQGAHRDPRARTVRDRGGRRRRHPVRGFRRWRHPADPPAAGVARR